jgi:hypothetical protein
MGQTGDSGTRVADPLAARAAGRSRSIPKVWRAHEGRRGLAELVDSSRFLMLVVARTLAHVRDERRRRALVLVSRAVGSGTWRPPSLPPVVGIAPSRVPLGLLFGVPTVPHPRPGVRAVQGAPGARPELSRTTPLWGSLGGAARGSPRHGDLALVNHLAGQACRRWCCTDGVPPTPQISPNDRRHSTTRPPFTKGPRCRTSPSASPAMTRESARNAWAATNPGHLGRCRVCGRDQSLRGATRPTPARARPRRGSSLGSGKPPVGLPFGQVT